VSNTETVEQHTHPSWDRLAIIRRNTSRFYHCRTYLDGRLVQHSLRTDKLTLALKLAEEWYLVQLRASRAKEKEHPHEQAELPILAELFQNYSAELTTVQMKEAKMRWSPIQGFWGKVELPAIGPQTFKQFYVWRRKNRKNISNHTLHKDVVLVRQMLKYAVEAGHIPALPSIPVPGKIEPNPRPWLTREEWETLCKHAEARIHDVAHDARLARQRQETYDIARFMVASMCRVKEWQRLTFAHCKVEQVGAQQTLRMELQGKKGFRIGYASPDAVKIYERRKGEEGKSKLFAQHHVRAFKKLLEDANLYYDAFGNTRNYKSLRATAISFALLKGVDIIWVARNAGTSIEMIDKFYAKRLTAEVGKTNVLAAFQPLPDFWV
jgi:hypothetical protein